MQRIQIRTMDAFGTAVIVDRLLWVRRAMAVCGSLALLIITDVSAHHAFSANYDLEDIGTVQGVVEEVFWANPHVHYYIRVENDDGSDELWDVETMNVSTMTRRGWTRSTLTVGDEITVTGPQGRSGARRISMSEVERVDGKPLPEGRP